MFLLVFIKQQLLSKLQTLLPVERIQIDDVIKDRVVGVKTLHAAVSYVLIILDLAHCSWDCGMLLDYC